MKARGGSGGGCYGVLVEMKVEMVKVVVASPFFRPTFRQPSPLYRDHHQPPLPATTSPPHPNPRHLHLPTETLPAAPNPHVTTTTKTITATISLVPPSCVWFFLSPARVRLFVWVFNTSSAYGLIHFRMCLVHYITTTRVAVGSR